MARYGTLVWAIAVLLLLVQNTVLAKSAGCGKTPSLTNGVKTTNIAGKPREYILNIPKNYDKNKPYKLIFTLHWLLGNMNNVAKGQWSQPYYGLEKLANGSAIFVSPNGLSSGWSNPGGNDVQFIDDMLKTIENDLCIDETQRYSTGFSYGGGMSFSLACSRPNVFRAVAVLSGARLSGCAGGKDPVAYLGIHGGTDSILPYARGMDIRNQFVKNNGCKMVDTPAPAKGSRKSIKTVFEGCSPGHPVVWIAFDGDHTPSPSDQAKGVFAGTEIWSFFSQFF
jgi:poly(3-hydroxybutyrate) depolymerase